MLKRVLLPTLAGVVVLGGLGLLLTETRNRADDEASTVYLIVIGIATLVAASYLGWTALRSRRRSGGRRPLRNDATRD